MRSFYNPALSDEQADALDWENMVCLSAVQASLGNIGPSTQALFVEVREEQVLLHWVVTAGESEDIAEDAEDTVSQLDINLPSASRASEVSWRLHIEEVPRDWTQQGWRCIFWRKGWAAWREESQES